MPSAPAGFTDQERELVHATLFERYARVVPLQDVEVELLIDAAAPGPVACAALYWRDGAAEFVVARVVGPVGPTFRAQFFYGQGDDAEVFGTGHSDYGNLGDCVVTLLQVQAAHAAEARNKASPAANRPAQPDITGDEDYDGPLVI